MSHAEATTPSEHAGKLSPKAISRLGQSVFLGLAVLLTAAVVASLITTQQRPNEQIVLFFEDSVNGLLNGAPVKLNGVPIGHVESASLRLPHNGNGKVYAQIHVTLKGKTLHSKGIPPHFAEPQTLKKEIEHGLRGKLAVLSPIAGTFYVELGYRPDIPASFVSLPSEKLPEIPIIPRPISNEKLTTYADNLLTFSQFNFKALEREWNTVLDNALTQTDPARARAINNTALGKLQKMHTLLANTDLLNECRKLNQDMAQLGKITKLDGTSLEKSLTEKIKKLTQLHLSLNRIQTRISEIVLIPTDPKLRILLHELNETIEWIENFRAKIPNPENPHLPR
ncbi:MAG: MlaD family protein [Puniceicoccales bacterium]|jgi:hypothetical protein|nr:MlaD family protein [Puniceicoccales bacterium]